MVYLSRIKFYPPLHLVENRLLNTPDEVISTLTHLTDLGYEGIILRELSALYIRRRSTQVMKWKPKKADFYPVVGVLQERDKFGNLKPSVGALVCTSDEGTTFSVGSGLTAQQRREWWLSRAEIPGQFLAKVQYQNITPKGVPRFPVLVDLIPLYVEKINEGEEP